MRWWRRRLPPALRPTLGPEERILAWASADDGGVVVATTHGLWLPAGAGAGAGRLGWHEVHKIAWSGEVLSVTAGQVVAEGAEADVVEDVAVGVYRLAEPGDLPHQVRERVTRSVVHSSHHGLPGGGVRVVARRVSGADALWWALRYDPGTDRADGAVAAAAAALLDEARAVTAGSGLGSRRNPR